MRKEATFLFYNHGGSDNRGCEAIVRSTSALLRAHFTGAKVMLCSLDPAQDASLDGVDAVIRHGVAPFSPDRIINSFASRLGATRAQQIVRNNMPFLRRARRADVCFSIGGDTYCYKAPELLYSVNPKLKAQGTPTVLWGCSVEPSLLEDETLLSDLRTYDLIVARESISAQALREKGLPVYEWIDPAFTLQAEEAPLPEEFVQGKTVGLNVSPLILQHAKDKKGALQAFEGLIRHILETTDFSVALLPHVLWAHDDDRQALAQLLAAFDGESRVFMVPARNAPQMKYIISKLAMLVTARTHASVAAYSTGVPTLVIGYSVKARGIARDIYGEEAGHLLPVQELSSPKQLIAAFDHLNAGAAQERIFLGTRMQTYITGTEAVLRRVEALI